MARRGEHGCLALGLKLEVADTGINWMTMVRLGWILRVLFDNISKTLGEGKGKITELRDQGYYCGPLKSTADICFVKVWHYKGPT